MNPSPASCRYELRFRSLLHEGRAFVFPCDAQGLVDMDSMGLRMLNNYLYARSVIGRELALPSVQASPFH